MKKNNHKKAGLLLVLGMAFILPSFAQSIFKNPEEILAALKTPDSTHVLVVAHRGDWRNAPENSIRAVENVLKMGVEIVEIDVQRTADGELIVMHDKTIDRTTTGKGKIADLHLDSIRRVFLKNGAGMPTQHRVPTLREMMSFVKGKPILVNLDKAWQDMPQVYHLLKETGAIKQAIFKGNQSVGELRQSIGALVDSITYMPMVWPKDYHIYDTEDTTTPMQFVQDFVLAYRPVAFEVIYNKEESPVFDVIKLLNREGIAVWVNTLWAELCAGHQDDLAIDDPDAHWGWVIRHGADLIQTDRPQALIHYLKEKGWRR
ncbi:glycerophosphodiester phosphodiesterase family protein [Sphingobacterium griseoflavum]|uniref:Glycerophosphoryl diester phosphodiesterase n=1 Tax=Sphingobacterium griseoflavum TaxID=1474952 RepID=A0ABQ3HRU2_9SPHI|nr:glycerophosphodiester phosphodiesterase family protein [Sphingobacterium griseoflavum]GHE28585.1 glycerophosphoryl diester phosphodiesterase [Sphingobacterium griseoflavum]